MAPADNPKRLQEPGKLNPAQKMHLRVSCEYIDKLLSDIEGIIRAPESKSPFPRYINDLAPAQTRVAEHYIQRIRAQLLRTLEWQTIEVSTPDIPSRRAILTHLNFIGITLDELRPKSMRGSGSLSSDVAEQLNGVIHELRTIVDGMEIFLRQDNEGGFTARFKRLQDQGQDVNLLKTLEEIIARNGLVEFRPRINTLLAALENRRFEVALFGRVSSGKSSLLNALLSTTILPVGVTPITAVPIRIKYGEENRATISFGDGRKEQVGVVTFRSLVSEEGNPGNKEGVTRVTVDVPSPRLKEHIVLVDTPGLGSLARQGSRETLAYLPSCDLALLLIDASSPVNENDIDTLRLLYEAGIESLVLLSKADILTEEDLGRAIQYTEGRLKEEMETAVKVYPVSAQQEKAKWLDDFYQFQLHPLFERALTMRERSTARKLGALRDLIVATLELLAQRDQRQSTLKPDEIGAIAGKLRQTTGEVGELASKLDRNMIDIVNDLDVIIGEVSNQLATSLASTKVRSIPHQRVADVFLDTVNGHLRILIEQIRQTAERGVLSLQEAAQTLHTSEAPDIRDIDGLLRDMPRFEFIGQLPEIDAGYARFFGRSAVLSRIERELRRLAGPSLNRSLESWRIAATPWMRRAAERLQIFIQSYVDTYRPLLGQSYDTAEPQQRVTASEDLELLRNRSHYSLKNNEVEQIGA